LNTILSSHLFSPCFVGSFPACYLSYAHLAIDRLKHVEKKPPDWAAFTHFPAFTIYVT